MPQTNQHVVAADPLFCRYPFIVANVGPTAVLAFVRTVGTFVVLNWHVL